MPSADALPGWRRICSLVPSALLGDLFDLTLRVAFTAFFCVLSVCREGVSLSNCRQRTCRVKWAGTAGLGTLPGFWRSMVLSWLVRPPEEESPLDVPSWPKWGSKDNSVCGAAAYLQRRERRQSQGEGLVCQKTLEPEACSAVGFKHRGGSKGRGA